MSSWTPSAPVRPKFVPVADVAEALGVSEGAVLEVMPAAYGRVAQLPNGSQRHEIDPARVHRIAASLGREVPKGYPS
jgi:hypothetical protein